MAKCYVCNYNDVANEREICPVCRKMYDLPQYYHENAGAAQSVQGEISGAAGTVRNNSKMQYQIPGTRYGSSEQQPAWPMQDQYNESAPAGRQNEKNQVNPVLMPWINDRSGTEGASRPRRSIMVGGQKPYLPDVQTDPYGNSIIPDGGGKYNPAKTGGVSSEEVSAAADTAVSRGHQQQAAQNTKHTVSQSYVTKGIAKNIVEDVEEKRGFLHKYFRALIWGYPYCMIDNLISFQVFPDYTGQATTSSGTACDQIVVYGKINKGLINENNEVEIYGKRASDGTICVNYIKNLASGTRIKPTGIIPATIIRAITAGIFILFALVALAL